MFYSNRSTFEDPQGPYYWQENFGEYQGNNKPPTSPVIVFLFNAVYNKNPLSWQLNEASKYLGLYGHPNLYGFGIWLYEYMSDADWGVWDEWVKTLAQYGVPPPSATFNLTISTNDASMGTTSPAPGTYAIQSNTSQQVTAIPNTNYRFVNWLLDGTARTENPITVLMDRDYTLEAVFEYVSPPPETATIKGVVTDRETGAALADVAVTSDGYADVTETNGQYELLDIPAKAYTLTFTREGYNKLTVDIDASTGGTFTRDVSMEPVPPTAPTLFDKAWAAFTEFSGKLKLPVPPKPAQPPKLPIEE